MDLAIEDGTSGSWTMVRVAGELDLHTSPQLRDHVLAMVGPKPLRLALDLSEVDFMDSSSLGMLITCLKRVRERDGRMVLVGLSGSPMKVLTLTGLDKVFKLVPMAADLPPD